MRKRNLVIYVSGNCGDKDISENIYKVREAAIQIWEAGYTPLAPYLSTAQYWKDCFCSQKEYLEGIIELLYRCDAIYMLDGWEDSELAHEERNHALAEMLPIAYTIEQLNDHFKDWK